MWSTLSKCQDTICQLKPPQAASSKVQGPKDTLVPEQGADTQAMKHQQKTGRGRLLPPGHRPTPQLTHGATFEDPL